MAFDKDAFLTALDSMTVMELNDLVKAIEEVWCERCCHGSPAAGGAAGGGAAAAEEKTEFNVVLTEAGANKVPSSRLCAKSPAWASGKKPRTWLDGAPKNVKKALPRLTPKLPRRSWKAGAKVELVIGFVGWRRLEEASSLCCFKTHTKSGVDHGWFLCLLTPTAEDALVRAACNAWPSARDW